MENQPTFSELLRGHVERLGIRQAHLARATGMSRVTVHNWLNDSVRSPYHLENVLRIAAELGLTRLQADELLRAANQPSIEQLMARTSDTVVQQLVKPWRVDTPHTLPADVTSFVGREDEILAIAGRLNAPDTRLVTLTGPGGSGKTRLALRVAREMLDVFIGGVYFVPLEDLQDPEGFLPALLAALRIRDVPDEDPMQQLTRYLFGKPVLLILDNLEQIVKVGPAIADLLQRMPQLAILATSRISLRIRAEHVQSVDPLPVPPEDSDMDIVRASPAVTMFIDRARAAGAELHEDSDTDIEAVVTICRLLDGLPLAIELAAARATTLSPADMLHAFAGSLEVARHGPRDASARQRSLRAAFDWSYALLPEDARQVFRALSVFTGSWALDDVRAVVAPNWPEERLKAAHNELLDANMIRRLERRGRFGMLQTMKEYSERELDSTDEGDELRRRHAKYFLERSKEIPEFIPRTRIGEWVARIEPEYDNVIEALQWATDRRDLDVATGIAARLWPFWMETSRLNEGRLWLEHVYRGMENQPADIRARVETGLLFIISSQADYETAQRHGRCAYESWLEIGDDVQLGLVTTQIAWCNHMTGEFDAALEHLSRAEQSWHRAGRLDGVSWVERQLAFLYGTTGEFARAAEHLDRSERLIQELDDRLSLGDVFSIRGSISLFQGNLEQAIADLNQALKIMSVYPETYLAPAAHFSLGTAYTFAGQLADAAVQHSASIEGRIRMGDKLGLTYNILGVAAIAGHQGNFSRAAWLAGAGLELQRSYDIALNPAAQAIVDREMALIQEQLDPETFQREWDAGSMADLDSALELAVSTLQPLTAQASATDDEAVD